MVRDNTYLNDTQGSRDWSYHDYRDCNIDNFVATAEELAGRGFCVIRMGHHTSKLKSEHPLIIDYATNGMRDDFMDIYLASICHFIISTGHGAEAPAGWCFRKPRVVVNHCPTGYLQTFSHKDLLLTKHHILSKEDRELRLSEIFSKGVGFCMQSQCYKDKGVHLKENTPVEICDIVKEMVDRLEGNWVTKLDDELLQKSFWGLYPVEASTLDGKPLHGEIKARFGAAFLRNNPNWLK